MLWHILFAVATVFILFLIIVATRPADFRIVRSATMAAPASDIFAQINDFHNWKNWSPWAHLDPQMQEKYEGAPAGAGAIYSWVGNKKVGQGRMTLNESRPFDLIRITLEFLAPFKTTNQTEFAMKPEGPQTAVTWTMTGRNNFMAKAFCMFMNMDKLVGGDFERGLAKLKSVVEKTA